MGIWEQTDGFIKQRLRERSNVGDSPLQNPLGSGDPVNRNASETRNGDFEGCGRPIANDYDAINAGMRRLRGEGL